MSAVEFLSRLRALDIKIWAEGDRLRYNAPEGALTAVLRAELSQRKAELLDFLCQAKTTPLQPVARDAPLQLSFEQQRLWFLQQLQPESFAYNIPLVTHLSGPLNLNALEQSLCKIIRRHESLRTTFEMVNEHPAQIIQPAVDYPLAPVACALAEAEQWLAEDAQQPFNLAQGPLMRAKLFRLAAQEYILYFNFHHIIFDGWSMNRFSRELALLYAAHSGADSIPWPAELPLQYADFAHWERQQFETTGRPGLTYWREKLGGELPTLHLPADRPRPAAQRFVGDKYEFVLSESLTQTLKKLSQEQNVTLFMTLLAAFKTLLHRYSGQDDILVGAPSANRARREVEALIGFFVNTLVLRTDLSGNPTFLEVLGRVREVVLQAQTYQDTPFGKLVEELHPERNLSRQPLFQVMFVLQPPAGEFGGAPALRGLTATPLKIIKNHTAKFDLTLEMFEGEQGLTGLFEYSTDLFNAETITRMAGHLQMLLTGVAANPNQNISTLPLLTEPERHQILVEWNDTAREYPKSQCVHQLFEAQVERMPNEVAVVFEEEQLTYAELNARANQLAYHLQTLGVEPDTVVALALERSLEMMVGLLGILKAGGAYLPLDPLLPAERLRFMLADARARVLVTQHQLANLFTGQKATIVCLDTDADVIARQPVRNPDGRVQVKDLVYVLFTSGSTGKPKGVAVEHRQLLNYLNGVLEKLKFPPRAAFAVVSTFATDLGHTSIFPALCGGGCLHIISQERASDPEALADYFQRQPMDCLKIVPSHLAALLNCSQPEKILPRQRLVLGGEASHWDLIKKAQKLAPACVIFNHYGPTETTVGALTYRLGQEPIERDLATVPLGRPIANTQIYLLDAHLQPVPVGVSGEIYIGGAGVARGYLHRPDLTAERFIASPFAGAGADSERRPARLYKTGDLARYLPDGNIEFLGRVDNQVKIRGFRIELDEIDAALQQHPAVQQALTLAREDNGQNKRLIAYIIPKSQNSPAPNDLRNFLKQNLPEPMIPTAFILLDKFPLTLNGKINRPALPIPETARPELSADYALPRNDVEQLIADIWAKVLKLDRIGSDDNFFELGGHSLQVAQIVFQLRQKFGRDLALRDFFNAPTVAGLARAVQTFADKQQEPIVNLAAEVVLSPAIAPQKTLAQHAPAAVFLTGATGFLGAFLLAEILQKTTEKVYCLVRAAEAEAGYQKIADALKTYLLWDEKFKSRLEPVPGDLASAQLGLSTQEFKALASQIKAIYHCGAAVNFVYPYQKLKPANVGGTHTILELAAINTIPVHYVSTMSVFASEKYFDGRVIYEDDELVSGDGLINGYSQSKWVAEKLVQVGRGRGLPVAIYRPGLVVGDSRTGAWKTGDFLTTFIKGCLALGSMPTFDRIWQMMPVNFVSAAIIHLAQKPHSLGKIFHLTTPYSLSTPELGALIQSLGYPLRLMPYAAWRAELMDVTQHDLAHPLYPLFLLFAQSEERKEIYTAEKTPRYDDQNLHEGLAGSGIVCPPVSRDLLAAHFSYFVDSGFLAAP